MEKLLYVRETLNLELLWFFLNHLPTDILNARCHTLVGSWTFFFSTFSWWLCINKVWPVKGREQAAGAEQHRAHRQHGPLLVDPVQVASGHIRHADGPRGTVHELVSIPFREKQSPGWLSSAVKSFWSDFLFAHSQADFVVETCNTLVGPIFTQRGEDVSQGVWPTAGHKINTFVLITDSGRSWSS